MGAVPELPTGQRRDIAEPGYNSPSLGDRGTKLPCRDRDSG